MKNYDFDKAKEELYTLQKKLCAYEHAMGAIYYDGVTVAPKETAENRAVSFSVLTEESYLLATRDETVELLEYLDGKKDELTEKERRMVYLLLKDIREKKKIPMNKAFIGINFYLIIRGGSTRNHG